MNLILHTLLNLRVRLLLAGCLPLLVFIPTKATSQSLQLNYKIIQGGDDIGWLKLEKTIAGTTTNLTAISEIKTRLIFEINVFTKETSIFESGNLVYSSQFRKNNDNIKLDKQIKLVDNKYVILENGEKENLAIPSIRTNLLSLFFNEPIDIDVAYCETQECFVAVVKMVDGGYKVKLPDGNTNSYYYSGGVCTKIKINHTFYSAEIILKP